MKTLKPLAQLALLAASVILFAAGCVVAQPREGYYDRDHQRWYHEHGWVACNERDEHCH